MKEKVNRNVIKIHFIYVALFIKLKAAVHIKR